MRDYVQRAIDAHGLPGTVVAATDRQELLQDADCVVTAVSIGGAAYWGEPYRSEVEIPLSYGVVQTVADTVGVGGCSAGLYPRFLPLRSLLGGYWRSWPECRHYDGPYQAIAMFSVPVTQAARYLDSCPVDHHTGDFVKVAQNL